METRIMRFVAAALFLLLWLADSASASKPGEHATEATAGHGTEECPDYGGLFRKRLPPPEMKGPQHSPQGAAFDQSPLRRPSFPESADPLTPLGNTGNIHFDSVCPGVQAELDKGMGLLHGFLWQEAERWFREAYTRDKNCVIAAWGMAMAANGDIFGNSVMPRASELIDKAKERLKARVLPEGKDHQEKERIARIAKRDQSLIDAFARMYEKPDPNSIDRRRRYLAELEAIEEANPQDIEVKAILAFAYLKNGDTHGVVWDTPAADPEVRKEIARLKDLTRQILEVNPDHPIHHHVIHALNYRQDQEALRSAYRSGPSASGIPHMWHMSSHTHYALGGEETDGYRIAAYYQEAALRAYHRYFKTTELPPSQIGDYYHNIGWLLETLGRVGQGKKAVQISKRLIASAQEVEAGYPGTFSRALGQNRLLDTLARFGYWDEAIALSKTPYLMRGEDPELEAKRLRVLGEAYFAKKDTAHLAQALRWVDCLAMADGRFGTPNVSLGKSVDLARLELAAYLDTLAGRKKEAAGKLRQLAKILPQKAHYYQTWHGPFREMVARALHETGETDAALEVARAAVAESPNEVPPLTALVDLLRKAKRGEEAEKLAPHLARISSSENPFAGKDPKTFPLLERFGPIVPVPDRVPDVTLRLIGSEKPFSLARSEDGKPQLVFFSLGTACPLCNQQMAALEDKRNDLREFSTLFVTNQTESEFLSALASQAVSGRAFHMRTVADPGLVAFRAFGALDEFEEVPLPMHGIFLIQDGKILLKKVSAIALLNVDAVIAEAHRLAELNRPRR